MEHLPLIAPVQEWARIIGKPGRAGVRLLNREIREGRLLDLKYLGRRGELWVHRDDYLKWVASTRRPEAEPKNRTRWGGQGMAKQGISRQRFFDRAKKGAA
jgi:hypothetical protein